MAVLLQTGGGENGSDRARGAALFTDHFAEICGGNSELDDGGVAFRYVQFHFIRRICQGFGYVPDQLFHKGMGG